MPVDRLPSRTVSYLSAEPGRMQFQRFTVMREAAHEASLGCSRATELLPAALGQQADQACVVLRRVLGMLDRYGADCLQDALDMADEWQALPRLLRSACESVHGLPELLHVTPVLEQALDAACQFTGDLEEELVAVQGLYSRVETLEADARQYQGSVMQARANRALLDPQVEEAVTQAAVVAAQVELVVPSGEALPLLGAGAADMLRQRAAAAADALARLVEELHAFDPAQHAQADLSTLPGDGSVDQPAGRPVRTSTPRPATQGMGLLGH